MLDHVRTHTASFWARSFVNVLEESIAASEQSSCTPILDTACLLKKYRDSKKRLLCFDYDVGCNLQLFIVTGPILYFRAHYLLFQSSLDQVLPPNPCSRHFNYFATTPTTKFGLFQEEMKLRWINGWAK